MKISGLSPLDEAILRESRRELVVQDGDETVSMTLEELVVRTLVRGALKGDPKLLALFMRYHSAAAAKEQKLKTEHFTTMLHYREGWLLKLEELEAEGKRLPDLVPHPDDIKIDMATGEVELTGPLLPSEKRRWAEYEEIRDNLIGQIEERGGLESPEGDSLQEDKQQRFQVSLLNIGLPPYRHRWWAARPADIRVKAPIETVRARNEALYTLANRDVIEGGVPAGNVDALRLLVDRLNEDLPDGLRINEDSGPAEWERTQDQATCIRICLEALATLNTADSSKRQVEVAHNTLAIFAADLPEELRCWSPLFPPDLGRRRKRRSDTVRPRAGGKPPAVPAADPSRVE